MEKNNIKKQHNVYVSEEENTLNWLEIQSAFKKTTFSFFIFTAPNVVSFKSCNFSRISI